MTAAKNFLQTAFEVTGSAGAGTGHTMDGMPDVRGVIDYWETAEGLQFSVKGWINKKYLGFMYIAGVEEYPFFNLQQMYLDGFRFGE
jgi:hypothetical protein